MSGWRARIGLLLPSPNVVLEPDFSMVAPEGVSIHASRLYLTEAEAESIVKMEDELDRAAREISTICPSAVGYGCTAGSFLKGFGYDQKLIEKIRRIVNVPVTTTSTAVVKALRELSLNHISVASPYVKEVNAKVKEFLEANGFKVLNVEGLGVHHAVEIADVNPTEIYRFAKKTFDSNAEGLFISCTNFRALEVLESLERDLGKPVVSSNQATIWELLKLAGIREAINGYGRLLSFKGWV